MKLNKCFHSNDNFFFYSFARWLLFHSASQHKPLHQTQSIIFHRVRDERTERKVGMTRGGMKMAKVRGWKKIYLRWFLFSSCAWNFFRQIFLLLRGDWTFILYWYFGSGRRAEQVYFAFLDSRGTNYHKNQVAKLDESFLRLSNAWSTKRKYAKRENATTKSAAETIATVKFHITRHTTTK